MEQPYSDAVVFFGATGDLAYKQIFPSLQKLAKRGKLTGPVIGVAKAGWNLEQFKARAQDSVENMAELDPAAFPSCWTNCATSTATTKTLRPSPMSAKSWAAQNIPSTIWRFRPFSSGKVLDPVEGIWLVPGRAGGDRKAFWQRLGVCRGA